MIRAALLLALVCATPVAATDLPALFSVTDVATHDVLNVRAAPSSQSQIVASLPPNATGVEVVARSQDGRWGLINIGERTGWAALRFLTTRPGQTLPPERYTCVGTEPFWSLTVSATKVVWSGIDMDPVNMSLAWTDTGRHPNRFGLRALASGADVSATIRREACSDGMSDRAYGFGIDLILDLRDTSSPIMFSGCCTISP